jgi:hypothetical protein
LRLLYLILLRVLNLLLLLGRSSASKDVELRLIRGGRSAQDAGDDEVHELVAERLDDRRCMEVNEGWRTMPYLADGSVGVGLVLDHYLTHRQDEQFAEAAAAIRRAAESPFYVEPGLFHASHSQ